VKPFTYRDHGFSLSDTTTTVWEGGRETTRWIIECSGPHGWRAGFNCRPTDAEDAKSLLDGRIERAEHLQREREDLRHLTLAEFDYAVRMGDI
jgi:hypothetical protein